MELISSRIYASGFLVVLAKNFPTLFGNARVDWPSHQEFAEGQVRGAEI